MPTTQKYGFLGMSEVTINDDGSIDIPVIVQESGLYVGSAPPELRIHTLATYHDDVFNRQYVAELNRKTDLPFYLTTARVKIVGPLEKVTDQTNDLAGIERLPEVE